MGHLDTKRDWGFAGDYVEAMWLMLQQDRPEDFIIGTGQSHSVREFAEIAATELGIKLHWEGEGINEVGKDENGKVIVKVNEKFYRPTDPFYLLADPSKAIKVLGWKPRVDFRALIKMMVTEDLKALKS